MVKQARILVVDDDANTIKTMKAILEDEGYIVDTATSGNEALQKTKQKPYNIALLDIRLPDMEGVELLKLIKETVPRTRKIMITGYPSMQNAITSLNKSADAYLIKPLNMESLLSTIKKQLELQENERAFSEEKVTEFIETRVRELSVDHV